MPTWLRRLLGIPDPPPLWLPVYQDRAKLTISQSNNSGGIAIQQLNPQYFLSRESAYYLAGLYGAAVSEDIFEGAGGAEFSGAMKYTLHWADGVTLNSGALAYYYCPASDPMDPSKPGRPAQAVLDNPDLAVRECQAVIAAARADMLHQVR